MKILIVDDDLGYLQFIKIFLSQAFQDIDVESNPEKALQRIEENNYDFVITDYNMPYMTGLELLKKIKRFNPEIIVIVHSASDNILIKRDVLINGAYAFYIKPAHDRILNNIARLYKLKKLFNL